MTDGVCSMNECRYLSTICSPANEPDLEQHGVPPIVQVFHASDNLLAHPTIQPWTASVAGTSIRITAVTAVHKNRGRVAAA